MEHNVIYIGNDRCRLYVGSSRRCVVTEPLVPYDAEIEYLGFTAGCSIDTGIYPSTNYKYSWRYLWNSFVNYTYPITNLGSSGSWFIFGGIETSQRTEIHIKKSSRITGLNLSTNTLYDCSFAHVGSNLTLTCNNGSISVEYQDYTSPTTLKLNIASNKAVEVDFYGFSIIDDNNNTILDLIPVRKGTTGYMYDRVSGQLLGNAGTGDFILGNDKT